jgi:hypothetical protein
MMRFSKSQILFIDEFDSLPAAVIDQLVSLFRISGNEAR